MRSLDVVTKSFTVSDIRFPIMPSDWLELILGGLPANMRREH